MPSLNIKNEETYRLAQELSRETGESMTAAITLAVKERLDRHRQSIKRQGRLAWLNEITKETAAILNDGRTSKEMMDELYDPETGLPI